MRSILGTMNTGADAVAVGAVADYAVDGGPGIWVAVTMVVIRLLPELLSIFSARWRKAAG